MLNKVILNGYIGRDPEIKVTQKGRTIATVFLATRFSWKDDDREWQTHTDWHQITVFRESTAKWIKDILKKGDLVCVEGRLSYHPWTDKYRQNRFTPHIIIEDWHGRIERLGPSKASSSQKNDSDQEESSSLEDELQTGPVQASETSPSNTNLHPPQQ